MKKSETVVLTVDTGGAESAVKDILAGFQSLKTLAKDIGKAMAQAFVPLQNSLAATAGSMHSVTAAVTDATAALRDFVQAQAGDQLAEDIKEGFGFILNMISAVVGVAAALIAAGASATAVAITAAIAGLVALLVMAIAEVAAHWDEITQFFKEFFTQTIPQLWTQFVEWISAVASTVKEYFFAAVSAVGEFLTGCWQTVTAAWEGAVQWVQDAVVGPLMDMIAATVQWFEALFEGIGQKVNEVCCSIGVIAGNCWQTVKTLWSAVYGWFDQNVIQPLSGLFSGLWSGFLNHACVAWQAIQGALGNAWKWFRETVVDPMVNGVKGMINGIIGFINGMIAGIVRGVNAVIGVLNKLQFAVPDWIPGIGGMRLGFNLKEVTAPQIPYLARGAVLPANKPFMAVVGDQRHGTNIEAPLATIQEAVRMELGDLAAAMHAGLEALLAENRQLRRTVEAIEVGDTVIGQAAARYSHRQAVMRGGAI